MASANNAPPPDWTLIHKAKIKDLESGEFNSLDPFQTTLGIFQRVFLLIPLNLSYPYILEPMNFLLNIRGPGGHVVRKTTNSP
jgi:hypothetical protein